VFIIDEYSNSDLLYPKVNGSRVGTGFDESQVEHDKFRPLFGDAPDQLKVIPRSEWDARFDEQERLKSSLWHLRQYCGPNGGQMPTLDQNGQGFCWNYSPTRAAMYLRALMGLPYVRLSGHANACMIKGFRDEGGWNGLGADRLKSHGCPSVEFWKEKSMSRDNDNPQTWENAAGHKVTEEWMQITGHVADRMLSEEQLATCLFLNIPCPIDIPAWGHSICAIRWVRTERGAWGPGIDNSWTDQWGEMGYGVLQGNMAKWMSAVGLRVITASLN
jgi:hypothetical protein